MSADDATPAATPFHRARRTASPAKSPSKSIVMNTPRTAGASPWRIKVTVHAEPESDGDNTMSPTVKKVTRTKTTTVPLRDADATSPVKRRSRPRKSDAAATPRPKRNGTPARTNARSKSRDTSAGPADADTDVPVKRGRGRPRKSVPSAFENEETLVVQPTTSPAPVPETTQTTSQQTPQEDPSNRLHARKGTPHPAPVVISSDEESDQYSDVLTPTSGNEEEPVLVTSQPFDDDDENDDNDDGRDLTNFAFEEGTTRMPDDSTMIDNEGFSMVSVDSLPSGGGLSSPPKQDETPGPQPQSIGSIMQTDYLRPSAVRELSLQNRGAPKSSPGPSRFTTASKLTRSSPGIAAPRYTTPLVDAEGPSVPPSIQQAPASAKEIKTPIVGRVVTAGVALQGVLDPNRLTFAPSDTPPQADNDPLNDLFRGFSQGTRKQLQEGLRLGEQLANEQAEEQPTPVPNQANERKPKAAPKETVFRTQRKQRSRLLTPDEQDGQPSTSSPPPAGEGEVQYPTLAVTENMNLLPSPERSEDEADLGREAGTSPTLAATVDTQRHEVKAADDLDKQSQQDDYADIWQEEASRTSESSDPITTSSPHENTRERIRPFRRRSPNQIQDIEKIASSRQSTPSRAESAEPQSDSLDKSKRRLSTQTLEHQGPEDEHSIASDGSDDTGMFFQSKQPVQSRQRKAEKLDLSLLLNEGESLVPEGESSISESSLPDVAQVSAPITTRSNPFQDTPPKFAAFPSSPRKSSPLRREIRGSDISSDTPRRYDDSSRYEEGSSLPVPQSSPFHTQVGGDSILSTASDQRQFRAEMEGGTDSSIVHLRNEANGYLDAYEPQDRTLDEINEVTEHSKTWNQGSSILPSSPPRIEQSFTEGTSSMLAREQLHAEQSSGGLPVDRRLTDTMDGSELEQSEVSEETEAAPSSVVRSTPSRTAVPRQPSTRTSPQVVISSSIHAAPSTATAQQPSHPILAKITPLPKVEPWTKTHYKTLDNLYSAHLKHPHLFSSTNIPATPLSRTNASLLNGFLSATGKPFVGALFSAWGYSFTMTPELIVLCAVFMENLTLASIKEYEQVSGSPIQMGDCGPGRIGDRLKATDVMNRLATVVLGERVRQDEKKGKKIDRSQALSIIWP